MKRTRETKSKAATKKTRRSELSTTERVDRVEVLSHAEALLIESLSHTMENGWGSVLNWPVMIARPNGTRAYVLDQAVELAVDHLNDICKQIEVEILELSRLPAGAERKRYKVIEPLSKERPEPEERLHHVTKNINPSTGNRECLPNRTASTQVTQNSSNGG
jgi:hypothetical protein